MIPVVKVDDCILCGKCIEICPPQAIFIDNESLVINEEFCEECGYCAFVCPCNAIHIPFLLRFNQ